MKPSDRIDEIHDQLCLERNLRPTSELGIKMIMGAICEYLDEEWRKSNKRK